MIIEDMTIERMRDWRAGLTDTVLVTTNGCFDMIHVGHLSLLQYCVAKAMALTRRPAYKDVLPAVVVLVNTDESVGRIKPGRPVQPWYQRAAMVDAIQGVNYVLPLREDDPCRMLSILAPLIHVKDENYRSVVIPESRTVRDHGGRMDFAPRVWDVSTTGMMKHILTHYKLAGTEVVPVGKTETKGEVVA